MSFELPPDFRKIRKNISLEYKFMYFHIPKNAGSSLASYGEELWEPPYYGHIQAKETKSTLPKEIWDECFKFSTVRNPWDRVTSLWGYFRGMGPGHINYHDSNIKTSDTIRSYETFDEMVGSLETSGLLEDFHFFSQSYWLVDNSGEVLTDYLMRFERIQQDWSIVCDIVGLPEKYWVYRHRKKSDHPHYGEMFNDHSKETVAKIYSEDINRFGYTFEDGQ